MSTQLTTDRATDARTVGSSGPRFGLPRWAKSVAGFAVCIPAYGLLRAAGVLPRSSTPSLADLGSRLVTDLTGGPLLDATSITLLVAVQGLAIGAAIGIPLGIAIGLSRWIDRATRVVIEFVRPIPMVALIPVAVLLFGLELRMQVLLVSFACVWPLAVAARHAVRSVDPLWIDTSRVLGLSRVAVVRRVILPASVPGFATGLRTSSSIAIVVAVAIEIVAGSRGLGQYIAAGQIAGDPAVMFAGVVLAGALGMVCNTLLVRAEHIFAHWQIASTQERRR